MSVFGTRKHNLRPCVNMRCDLFKDLPNDFATDAMKNAIEGGIRSRECRFLRAEVSSESVDGLSDLQFLCRALYAEIRHSPQCAGKNHRIIREGIRKRGERDNQFIPVRTLAGAKACRKSYLRSSPWAPWE